MIFQDRRKNAAAAPKAPLQQSAQVGLRARVQPINSVIQERTVMCRVSVQEAVPCPSAPVALSAQESFRGRVICPFWVVILHKTAHNGVKEMIGGAGTRLNLARSARSGAARTSAAQQRERPRERQDSTHTRRCHHGLKSSWAAFL